ncbi:MAG: putative heme protein [Candidatus Accumulibacter regalis]|jgi:hypothetical protein|uniref:Heme protein n=1 Tax=Accumulibacter regalis TaxID=522306 RepID=A0A011RHS9_ACCRE|nr:DUF1924 domain-containing protein [Accumulibacter sp.]EXI90759.1 MAG: putative heme protein [Candidatus Accumulibacter regalis]HRE69069.1 DUF1924 domain-containing protein [Accumulibacter sp.]HRE84935.1 DUF1924 domain-containing protein [Accumulibacter sp.]
MKRHAQRHPRTKLLAATLAVLVSTTAFAAARDDLLAAYSAAAKSGDPHFAGFSATRGEAFHRQSFAGGKADTPACTSCHANDPRKSGQTPAGKAIDPVALSASPGRYADPAKVEKWFKRNCNDVLGRQCTAQEKGDWLSFMISQ